MIRYYYSIIRNAFTILHEVKTMDYMIKELEMNPNEYSQEYIYKYVKENILSVMHRTGRIETIVFGEENLPKEGGYMMYPNHQGKYDVYGIVSVHKDPCTFVMDIEKSYRIGVNQLVKLLKAKRLNKKDNRQAMKVINAVAEEVKEGRKYVLFPEGTYDNKKPNELLEFKPGCFKIALKSGVPIVPVVLVNSHIPYNSWSLRKVTTEVHYLEPIYYDEYKDMNTQQIAEMVKTKIANKIAEIQDNKKKNKRKKK